MEFIEIKCRNCGAYIKAHEGDTRLTCRFCGAQYVLRQTEEEKAVRNIDFGGRGALFRSFVPPNWRWQVFEDNSCSFSAAVTYGLILRRPPQNEQTAELRFYPFAYYKDYTQGTMITAPGVFGQQASDYFLDGWSGLRYRKLVKPQQYAYERLTAVYGRLDDIRVIPLDNAPLARRAQDFAQQTSQKLGKPAQVSPHKFKITFSQGGAQFSGFFATIFCYLPVSQQQQRSGGFLDMLSGFGMGLMPLTQKKGEPDWGRAFDIMLISRGCDEAEMERIFERFTAEIQYGPLYFALEQQELQNVSQIEQNGAVQRQQMAINASQRVSQTLSQTSDIVNSACADHARAVDRVIDNSTQGIRGVDNFTDSSGTRYEADVRYDHIYRRGDTFVGSTDGGLELGPDWEELKRG